MNKICTSIKQSKKLIKLGVDVNTVDMTYVSMKDYGENTYHLTVGKTDVDWAKDELGNLNWNDVYEKYIPAWSLSALLELIPESIDNNTDDFSQLQLTKKSVAYYYGDGALRRGFLRDNFINAVFEMIVWLKENNKI